ncbi:hypothetical protein O4J56_10305 [Nocardiopsis sp. RSe5-2]|uniref:DUF3592 domain-containing protein n=2 Tax=Nocardiopsis endophytica TaxID=3018445 RepID=A0ABT4U273_9ACTN|nr:DUF3592 domain-containing protein [Nocardiopsis endophytica]MDA2811028.1 hypothetical protein [Nocardiopsis endophytica]
MRRNRLLREGVRSDAEVVATGELAPPHQKEHPFTLRYFSPDGTVHHRTFTSGFRGIVPRPGWTVRVAFDPAAPDDVEIIDNPHLGPLPGTPALPPPKRALTLLHTYGLTVYAAVLVVLAVPFAIIDSDPAAPLMSAPFIVPALFAVDRFWLSERHLRKGLWTDPAQTQGVVTHCWAMRGRRGTYYPIIVEFPLPDGRIFRGGVPSDSSYAPSGIGQVKPVVYHPADPTIAYAGTPETLRGGASFMSVISLILLALLTALGIGPLVLTLLLALIYAF